MSCYAGLTLRCGSYLCGALLPAEVDLRVCQLWNLFGGDLVWSVDSHQVWKLLGGVMVRAKVSCHLFMAEDHLVGATKCSAICCLF